MPRSGITLTKPETNKFGLFVTGLPASGKSTIARQIACALDVECLDKDDFLEALFNEIEVTSLEHRSRLSRQSDELFEIAAQRSGSAVLVSHWRPLASAGSSGTPVPGIAAHFDVIAELHCSCAPDIASARFQARSRHPGHLDQARSASELLSSFEAMPQRFPIGLGRLLEIETDKPLELAAVIDQTLRLYAEVQKPRRSNHKNQITKFEGTT